MEATIKPFLRTFRVWTCLASALVFGFQSPAVAATPCPQNMKGYEHLKPDQPLSCACEPGAPGGSVWGTNRYTSDSSVCRAAQHSGGVSASGGVVQVHMAPGCARFQGTERNGVRSNSYGAYKSTFGFSSPVRPCAEETAVQEQDAGSTRKTAAAPAGKSFVTFFGVTSSKTKGIGARFPHGVRRVTAKYKWRDAPVGYQLGLRWYKSGQIVLTQGEAVKSRSGSVSWYLKMKQDGVLPVGDYKVVLIEGGRPTAELPFWIVPE